MKTRKTTKTAKQTANKTPAAKAPAPATKLAKPTTDHKLLGKAQTAVLELLAKGKPLTRGKISLKTGINSEIRPD